MIIFAVLCLIVGFICIARFTFKGISASIKAGKENKNMVCIIYNDDGNENES